MWIAALTTVALAFQPDTAMLRRVYEEGLARREREYGSADPRTAQAARDLGLFLIRAGDSAGARRALARAVAVDEKSLGLADPRTLEDAASLAAVSPPAEARPLLVRAAESPDPSVAGPALSTLAGMRKSAGDRAGAAALYRRALEKAEAADGKDSPIVALLLNARAPLVDPKEALNLLERALQIERQAMGPQSPQVLQTVRALAQLLRKQGREREAAALEARYSIAK